VLILDENFRLEQQAILHAWRIRTRKVGKDFAAFGADDADLIPLLLRQPSPTFFTHDEDFWRQSLLHPSYCLVWLDMDDTLGALYVRRFLRHADFDTNAKRLGKVVRVHAGGLTFYDTRHGKPKLAEWFRAI
jgi:hypothetical protein